jgi:hypothetical protein
MHLLYHSDSRQALPEDCPGLAFSHNQSRSYSQEEYPIHPYYRSKWLSAGATLVSGSSRRPIRRVIAKWNPSISNGLPPLGM